MKILDEKSYRIYTQKSELDKAINSLQGIIYGIHIDKISNVKEIDELKSWCNEHIAWRKREPFNNIIEYIDNALSDKIFTEEEKQDLLWMCQKYTSENSYYDKVTQDLQILQGICHGILADAKIRQQEIEGLQYWMKSNRHLASYYPYDEINSIVSNILSDDKVDEDEKAILKVYFSQFVNITNADIQEDILDSIADTYDFKGICAINPNIHFENTRFCFTGASNRAKRSEIAQVIVEQGAHFSNSVSKKLNYLLVGNGGNPCWAYACYGRKVEQVINYRREGHNILIVHEDDFWSVLE